MPLITCVDCNKSISDHAKECPHCGCPIEHSISTYAQTDEQQQSNKNKSKRNIKILIISVLVILILVITILVIVMSSSSNNNQNTAPKTTLEGAYKDNYYGYSYMFKITDSSLGEYGGTMTNMADTSRIHSWYIDDNTVYVDGDPTYYYVNDHLLEIATSTQVTNVGGEFGDGVGFDDTIYNVPSEFEYFDFCSMGDMDVCYEYESKLNLGSSDMKIMSYMVVDNILYVKEDYPPDESSYKTLYTMYYYNNCLYSTYYSKI